MKCRIDKNDDLVELFSLGDLAVSDFYPIGESQSRVKKTPLTLCLSKSSGLVQLKDTADFDAMYKRYWYHSGTNKTMTEELKGIAKSACDLIKPKEGDLWVDIGCNDGTLLSFVPPECKLIGFDPAHNNCQKAYDVADVVIEDYFSEAALRKVIPKARAKVVTSIAMFYDLPDPIDFCNQVYNVLETNGLWIIQMSYLPLMLDQLAFDNICHEHLEYYSFEALNSLLNKTGFKVVDCQVNDINGGSFRIYIQKATADPASFGTSPYRDVCNFRVRSVIEVEKTYDLKNPKVYLDWFERVKSLKQQTVSFIQEETRKGKTVWAYGASTKGNTLLQYFGLDNTLIKGIAERQEQKYNLETVATNIPIYSEEYVRAQKPDYMLVLPWHFISEFKTREIDFLRRGGKFIVPCPRFEVIGL